MPRYAVGTWLLDLTYDRAGHVIQEDRLTVAAGQRFAHWRDNVWSPPDGRLVFVEDQNTDATGTPTARVAAS